MSAHSLRLVVEIPGVEGQATFNLSGRDALIGRDASADILIEHATISGRHGLLRAGADGYTYVDLGSRNGSAHQRASDGPTSVSSGEAVTIAAGDTLLLGASDGPVSVRVVAGVSAFGAKRAQLPTLAPVGRTARTIVAAAPLSDLFVSAPDALAGLAAEALSAATADELAESALATLARIFPRAEGRAVRLCGTGFALEAGDPPPSGLAVEATSGEEVLLLQEDGDSLPTTKSIASAGIRAAVVAPLNAGGAHHGHLIVWSPLGIAALPPTTLQMVSVAASLLALAAAGLAVRLGGERTREQLEREIARLQRGDRTAQSRVVDPIGTAPGFVQAVSLIRSVAPSRVPVLVLGETGTGKEVMARALHRWSQRANKPFVAFNCAAVPEALIESELFGHVRGAFTGASVDRGGLFEEADGGTIFLDEIGEMPAVMQAKLLRVLQEGEVRRVGASRTSRVDVRVVSATHRDLPELVAEGRFRADLMYRLNAISVRVPPLRERPEDVELLAHYLLGRATGVANKQVPGFASNALAALQSYGFPGNVRELENEVLRAVALTAEGCAIRASAFSPAVAGKAPPVGVDDVAVGETGGSTIDVDTSRTLKETVEAVERAAIRAALERSDGNLAAAARSLGLTRPGMYKVMGRLDISR